MERELSEKRMPLNWVSETGKKVKDWERNEGLDPEVIGKIGVGLKIVQVDLEKPTVKEPYSGKPPLITFGSVGEGQLVKDNLIFSAYSKGNTYQNKDLLFRFLKSDSRLVRSVLEQAGFSYTDSHDWNVLWLNCPPQPYLYEGLNEYQRINHFPNSFEVTRKDRMSVHLKTMRDKFGYEDYGFFPETFIIPDEYSEFCSRYYSEKHVQWIVKPCNSSQGKGIFMLDSLSSLPSIEGCVVSRYINNPLLINDLKFDLRIYVLITSYDPLKIYIYDEGLTRFASEPYNASTKASKYSFLTNYSINKKNEKFVQNSDWKEDNIGHKWSLSGLFRKLSENGVDTVGLMSKIYDLVIKTILSVEVPVVAMARKLGVGKNNCFDLLGFDILIDSEFKPWLLEVNLSPSLATDSPLDLRIKGSLIADTLNIVGVRYYDRKKECMSRLRARIRARKNQTKQNDSKNKHDSSSKLLKKDISNVVKFKKIIVDSVEEAFRAKNFVRIYPSQGCQVYDRFFTMQRPANKALFLYLYSEQFLQAEDHAKIPKFEISKQKDQDRKEKPGENDKEKAKNKLIITGDDILIEYLSRVLHACKSVNPDYFKNDWKSAIEKFVNHYIWQNISSPLLTSLGLFQKLEFRIIEMKDRKKNVDLSYKELVNYQNQKQAVVRGFSALELENMLKSSTKSAAKDVMGCLFFESSGILTEIIKWLASSSMKQNEKFRGFKRKGSATIEALEKPKKNGV